VDHTAVEYSTVLSILVKCCPCFVVCALLPVWADADTWFERQQHEEEIKQLKKEHDSTVAKAVGGGRGGEGEESAEDRGLDPMEAAEARARGN